MKTWASAFRDVGSPARGLLSSRADPVSAVSSDGSPWCPNRHQGEASPSGNVEVPFVDRAPTLGYQDRSEGETDCGLHLRTYVDLAWVVAIATDFELAGIAAAVDYTEARIADFFPAARVHLFEFNDASKGLATEPARREVLPTATDIAASGGDEASVDAPASGRGSGAARGRGRGRR